MSTVWSVGCPNFAPRKTEIFLKSSFFRPRLPPLACKPSYSSDAVGSVPIITSRAPNPLSCEELDHMPTMVYYIQLPQYPVPTIPTTQLSQYPVFQFPVISERVPLYGASPPWWSHQFCDWFSLFQIDPSPNMGWGKRVWSATCLRICWKLTFKSGKPLWLFLVEGKSWHLI